MLDLLTDQRQEQDQGSTVAGLGITGQLPCADEMLHQKPARSRTEQRGLHYDGSPQTPMMQSGSGPPGGGRPSSAISATRRHPETIPIRRLRDAGTDGSMMIV